MSRIAAETPADFQFRTGDNVPTRAQKLEILRKALVLLLSNEDGDTIPLHTHEIEQVVGLADILDGLRTGQSYYRVGSFLTTAAEAVETIFLHIVTEDVEIPANFAGSKGHAGILPAAPMVFTIWKNPTFNVTEIVGGTQIGTMTVAVDGTFTFTTTGGVKQKLYLGDRIGIKAPSTVDTLRSAEYTFRLIAGFAVATILLSGDASDGDDELKLSGDMQASGLDVLLVSGDAVDG